MSHPLFGPEIRLMLQEGDAAEMKTFCETLHPATIAEALSEDFEPGEIWRVLQSTSIRDQASIFEYFPLDEQVKLAEGTGRPHMARLIETMSHDDRVHLLRRLQPRVAEGLLRLVDEADRRDIATLVNYQADTVGSLMTTDYAWIPVGLRAHEALERLRHQAPNSETIYYIYVLDDTTRKLHGVVSLRQLVLAGKGTPVRDLIEEDVQTLRANDPREKAAQELARYDFLAMPVVDDDGRLVGIVTHDDVMDVVVEEATEDAHMMGAVGPLAENYLEAPFVTIWRKRAFWLSCLFGAELFTFTALAFFEKEIDKLVVLSLFVPLCISTGGNSGSQAATLITRAMALGQVTLGNVFKVFRHELVMGIVLGLTLGGIAFLRGALTPEDVRGGTKEIDDPFAVRVAKAKDQPDLSGAVEFPAGSEMITAFGKDTRVTPAKGTSVEVVDEGGFKEYRFAKESTLREPPADRWKLAQVIAMAVMGICLWGTIVGSMLPFAFKWLGADPGVASSPFVATFVDVTGIVIYFSIAKMILL
ncbi:MAG: magnesium transporter [Gemmataceae bacterium]